MAEMIENLVSTIIPVFNRPVMIWSKVTGHGARRDLTAVIDRLQLAHDPH